jgi:hypothetical protein
MPLPDHPNQEIRKIVKISIRPSKSRKWGQEFKLEAMKSKLKQEVNVVW